MLGFKRMQISAATQFLAALVDSAGLLEVLVCQCKGYGENVYSRRAEVPNNPFWWLPGFTLAESKFR